MLCVLLQIWHRKKRNQVLKMGEREGGVEREEMEETRVEWMKNASLCNISWIVCQLEWEINTATATYYSTIYRMPAFKLTQIASSVCKRWWLCISYVYSLVEWNRTVEYSFSLAANRKIPKIPLATGTHCFNPLISFLFSVAAYILYSPCPLLYSELDATDFFSFFPWILIPKPIEIFWFVYATWILCMPRFPLFHTHTETHTHTLSQSFHRQHQGCQINAKEIFLICKTYVFPHSKSFKWKKKK